MSSEDRAWLAAMQFADSTFPSGAFTQSHGLEALVADGLLTGPASLVRLLETSLLHRLATSELPALLAAHTAGHAELLAIDHRLSAVKLGREEREASVRVGRRIAVEVLRLVPPHSWGGGAEGAGGAALSAFIEAIDTSQTPGNASVAQGVAAAALGIPAHNAALGACHSFATSLISAAMRLTRFGHGDAQAVLRQVQPVMVDAVATAAQVPWPKMRSSAFQLDIAMARHERAEARMFAS
jgi:urease accessory protein